MYPHERSLVKRLSGEPFALVGVNSDSDREKTKQVIQEKGLTWRSFWNGGSTRGPISTAWNVRGWPTIYVLELDDTGRTALPKDERRWPEVQRHLMAQSLGALKLLTIARGFDESFDDLHPKRLRRFHIGPMYSHSFTRQSGPIRDVLAEAKSPPGEDWTLAWTSEMLRSEDVTETRAGWFSTVEREMFALDPFSGRGVDTGATETQRAIILPQRPFQVLAEKNPPGFAAVRKFVVSPGGRVLSY